MRLARLSRVAAVAFAATGSLAGIRAEAECTPITYVSYQVTAPGVYCLAEDVIFLPLGGTPFIRILADDVTIDLAGHTLDGRSATVYGVYGHNRKNVTVRNGRLLGFGTGVFLAATTSTDDESGGHRIEDLDLRGIGSIGINVSGRGNLVRGNRIADTGTGLEYHTGEGIRVMGPAARVLDNEVIRTRGASTGIRVLNAPGSVVGGNRITETVGISQSASTAIVVSSSGSTLVHDNQVSNVTSFTNTTGVWVVNSNYVTVRDNTFSFLDRAIVFGAGAGTGKYMGNMTSGVTAPYSGGIAAGATNY